MNDLPLGKPTIKKGYLLVYSDVDKIIKNVAIGILITFSNIIFDTEQFNFGLQTCDSSRLRSRCGAGIKYISGRFDTMAYL